VLGSRCRLALFPVWALCGKVAGARDPRNSQRTTGGNIFLSCGV